jgi:hypothetical protein
MSNTSLADIAAVTVVERACHLRDSIKNNVSNHCGTNANCEADISPIVSDNADEDDIIEHPTPHHFAVMAVCLWDWSA